jgi:MerR family transcriptional regulator, copper efflux regulator
MAVTHPTSRPGTRGGTGTAARPDVHSMTIGEIAASSGVTTATVRYYERIGLLPHADRTPSGYRTYERPTLDRLAFIGRAKQLGCTLDEILDLVTAWDGGRCGPVQERLRGLVADKRRTTTERIVELTTFGGELARAGSALEQHRPDGACDAGCGCLAESADDVAVALSSKPNASEHPVACSLPPSLMQQRVADWDSVLSHVVRRDSIDGGVRCVFGATVPVERLTRLVVDEQTCCRFFRFAITVDAAGIALEVRAPDDAAAIVDALFGTAS